MWFQLELSFNLVKNDVYLTASITAASATGTISEKVSEKETISLLTTNYFIIRSSLSSQKTFIIQYYTS